MQRQNFVFNPMQLNGNSLQYNKQHNEETTRDFGPIGGGVRHRQPMQNTKPAEPLLLPPATKSRQFSDGQKENVAAKSGDKLATLHSRLHQEAEKVKQWKINTEMKLKEKDRKMTEANKTIDSLRKSILELQFLNESVSSKLQEEKTLQEETVQKIGITRNMCNALKEHLVKLENSVIVGENMLSVQKFENGQRIEQFQELVLKFQELEIRSNSKEHEMKKYVTKCEDEHKEEAESLKRKITEGEESIKSLQEMNDDYKQNMGRLSEQLAQFDETLRRYKDECANLELKLQEAKEMFKSQETMLNEEKCTKDTLMKNIECLEEEYGEKVSKMTSEYEKIMMELNDKNNQIDMQGCELQKRQAEIAELTESVQQKNVEVEQIKSHVEEIYKVKSELEILVNNLREELQSEHATLEEKEVLLKNKDVEKGELERLLLSERQIAEQLKDEMNKLQVEIERLNEREEYAVNLEAKMKELEDEKESLERDIKGKADEVEDKAAMLASSEQDNQSLREEVERMTQSITDLKNEKDRIVQDLEVKIVELDQQQSELETAKEQISQLEEKINELCQERDLHADAIQQEVGSRDKRIESSENKVKSIQSKLEMKTKLANKFQSETKSLKAQLKVQQKTNKKLEDELSATQEEIKKNQLESKELLESADKRSKDSIKDIERLRKESEKLQKEKDMLAKHVENLSKETEMSKQQSEMAQQQLAIEKQNFEAQITEMCTTLEKYKMENEKLMNAKEKEFDKQTRDLMQTKSSFEENLKAKQTEIDNFKKNIKQKDDQIKEMNDNLDQMKQQVTELESKLTESRKSVDVEMTTDGTKDGSRDSFVIVQEEKKQPKRPVTSSPKPNQAVTPKVPKTPRTPQMAVPVTPTSNLRTPQGILRVSEEKPARSKHVAFSITDDQLDSSDEEDVLIRPKKSPSVVSSTKKQSNINSVRPIIRASPSLSSTAKSSPMAVKPVSVLIESPGKRLKTSNPAQKPSEKEAFNKLFPKFDQEAKHGALKSNAMPKKMPFKSKVKKLTPKTKRGAKKETMDFSWFDSDAAFGFGMEE